MQQDDWLAKAIRSEIVKQAADAPYLHVTDASRQIWYKGPLDLDRLHKAVFDGFIRTVRESTGGILPKRPRGRLKAVDTKIYAPAKPRRTRKPPPPLVIDPLSGLPRRPIGRPRSDDNTVYASPGKPRIGKGGKRGNLPEDLTGQIFQGKWKALYRGPPIKPAIPGGQIPWMCQCLACEHEQWIKPLNLKGKYRSLCKECEYPKDCECGKPIEQNADFRFFLCSDCRENRSLKRARISSLKKNLAMKLARSHGFDPSPDEGTAWKTWAESLGVNLDNLAKEILEDVTTDGS